MKKKKLSGIKILILAFLLISVVFPLITVLLNIRLEDVGTIVRAPQFGGMMINSLAATLASTLISVTLAFLLAWCLNRSRMRFKSVCPFYHSHADLLISHGLGLVLLLADNGFLTNLLGVHVPLRLFWNYSGLAILFRWHF